MPALSLERLPLPNFQVYVTMSVILLGCALYHAVQFATYEELVISESGKDVCKAMEYEIQANSSKWIVEEKIGRFQSLVVWIKNVVWFMFQEPYCIWTIINMSYCCLIMIGKMVQRFVFGELRFAEHQHIKDKFWNFVFYKFIFIFGIMNVQFMDELVLWCSWFTVMGFLQLLVQLCRDRWEYLSFSPTTPKSVHIRLVVLLVAIFSVSLNLLIVSVYIGSQSGLNTFFFLAAECILVTLRSLYLIIRYAIHLSDQDSIWENKATLVYYTEFGFEVSSSSVDFLHHLHMLVWANIFLSMASLVIIMQLRQLFYDIRHRLKKYRNYLCIVRHMEINYPIASNQDLARNCDNCAICWEQMELARKLPCCHMFHNNCLRSWLEQDTSCPTCRMILTQSMRQQTPSLPSNHNHLFQFDGKTLFREKCIQIWEAFLIFLSDLKTNGLKSAKMIGSRYASWLPIFSLEVSQSIQPHLLMTSPQFDSLARQIQTMFPHFPLATIQEDLQITQSMELTIENILEQRIVPPLKQEYIPQPKVPSSDALLVQLPTTELRPIVLSTNHTGFRFSKSPQEREGILLQRKLEMLELAKRKYLCRRQSVPS